MRMIGSRERGATLLRSGAVRGSVWASLSVSLGVICWLYRRSQRHIESGSSWECGDSAAGDRGSGCRQLYRNASVPETLSRFKANFANWIPPKALPSGLLSAPGQGHERIFASSGAENVSPWTGPTSPERTRIGACLTSRIRELTWTDPDRDSRHPPTPTR
jgi:hypothetical protein